MKRKKVIAVTIDRELHEWFQEYAHRVKKTVSGLFSEQIYTLSSSAANKDK